MMCGPETVHGTGQVLTSSKSFTLVAESVSLPPPMPPTSNSTSSIFILPVRLRCLSCPSPWLQDAAVLCAGSGSNLPQQQHPPSASNRYPQLNRTVLTLSQHDTQKHSS
eukprot:161806-Rhodomonas_salina.2